MKKHTRMKKHTPGPWRTGKDLDNCGGGRNIVATIGGEEIRIAHTGRVVFAGEEYVSEDEAQANADLQAAAPDLADALEALLGVALLVANEKAEGNKWAIVIDPAQAALRKAGRL